VRASCNKPRRREEGRKLRKHLVQLGLQGVEAGVEGVAKSSAYTT